MNTVRKLTKLFNDLNKIVYIVHKVIILSGSSIWNPKFSRIISALADLRGRVQGTYPLSIFTACNEVAKVMFSQACVCPQGGAWYGGVPGPGGVCLGGAWSQGVSGPRGVPGPRGCLVETPNRRNGYCCGRYASYWNAFLFKIFINYVWGSWTTNNSLVPHL